LPLPPELAKGSDAVASWPDVSENVVAVPIVVPPGVRKLMLPVQDAAVPDEEFAAELSTLTRAVCVLPSPTSGNDKVRLGVVVVVVVVVCAAAENAAASPRKSNAKLLVYIWFFNSCLLSRFAVAS